MLLISAGFDASRAPRTNVPCCLLHPTLRGISTIGQHRDPFSLEEGQWSYHQHSNICDGAQKKKSREIATLRFWDWLVAIKWLFHMLTAALCMCAFIVAGLVVQADSLYSWATQLKVIHDC